MVIRSATPRSTSLRTLEAGAQTLHNAGFTPHQALHMINIVATFVIGHTLAEAGTTPATSPTPPTRPPP